MTSMTITETRPFDFEADRLARLPGMARYRRTLLDRAAQTWAAYCEVTTRAGAGYTGILEGGRLSAWYIHCSAHAEARRCLDVQKHEDPEGAKAGWTELNALSL